MSWPNEITVEWQSADTPPKKSDMYHVCNNETGASWIAVWSPMGQWITSDEGISFTDFKITHWCEFPKTPKQNKDDTYFELYQRNNAVSDMGNNVGLLCEKCKKPFFVIGNCDENIRHEINTIWKYHKKCISLVPIDDETSLDIDKWCMCRRG